jgi:PIN domain nuclease of toxin-antitoxin system
MLLKVRRLSLREPYNTWATRLVTHRGFALAAVDIEMLTTAYTYPFPDPFDSVITATAHVLDVPLITNDTEIHAAQVVDVYW